MLLKLIYIHELESINYVYLVRREPRNMNDTWQHDRFSGRPALNVAGPVRSFSSDLISVADVHY